jgi:hypothetical protein
MRAPEFRLRAPTAGLLALPWDRPLSQWNVPEVPLRDIAVGPSRHLVKFVEADDLLWAVKDMPARIAAKEYDVLRRLEEMELPAVRPAGLVLQPEFDTAILVTRYLEGSWQYRRLFMRLPPDEPKHRARLLDAMAGLLVELHRHGVFWGDCSLANTLFSRDGQVLQAWLVDAETSEVHPTLSRGQREHDLDIMVENVAMGMVDLAARLERSELEDVLIEEAEHTRDRYETLWQALHSAASMTSASPSTKSRCNPSATSRTSSNFMSPLVIGAITRSAFRSSPAWMLARVRRASCSATCAPIRRSCVARSDTTSTSGPPPGYGSSRS